MTAFLTELRGFIADLRTLHEEDESPTKPAIWSFLYEALQAYRAFAGE